MNQVKERSLILQQTSISTHICQLFHEKITLCHQSSILSNQEQSSQYREIKKKKGEIVVNSQKILMFLNDSLCFKKF